MQLIIRLDAGNDRNGNPRRAYVLIGSSMPPGDNGHPASDGSAILKAWDEGYAGVNAVPECHQVAARNAVRIETTPATYRTILRQHGQD